jgi:hypothetical protein
MINLQYLGYIVRFPENGNRNRTFKTKTTRRFAQCGEARVYLKTPATYTFTIQLKVYKCHAVYTSREDMMSFLEVSRGKEINYTDPDGNVWVVRIVSHPTSFADTDQNSYSAELVLEGVAA